ncbi:MAG TPA: hypothetical protein VFX58_16295, partial [Chitinophagaceae bacterium]|nr:hypothetical protein [Chitinophagaceae bacterium]
MADFVTPYTGLVYGMLVLVCGKEQGKNIIKWVVGQANAGPVLYRLELFIWWRDLPEIFGDRVTDPVGNP